MFKNFSFKKQAKAPSITKPTVRGTIMAAAIVGLSGILVSKILKKMLAPKEESAGMVRVFVIRQRECDSSESNEPEDELVTPAFNGRVPYEEGSSLIDELNQAMNRNESTGNETYSAKDHENDPAESEPNAVNTANASSNANGNGRKHRTK